MQKISDSTSSANAEGEFTEGSAAAGVPATLITAAWLNGIQRELVAIIAKAGLSPDANDFQQLSKAIFNSPALSGNPTAPTPAQFDNDTSLATTGFVQRALGSFAGQININASAALTMAHAGMIINAGGTITLTLPAGASVVPGASFKINNASNGVVTVQASAGNNLYAIGNSTARTFALQAGDELTIAYVGGSSWYAWGSGQLGLSGGFSASLLNPGWRKLPTGEIEQWQTVTFTAVGAYNQKVIGGATFYTSYYNITYPMAYVSAVFEAQATLACATFASQAEMAGKGISLNLSGTGNPLTGMTIAVTTPNLGEIPTVHWRSRGK